LDVIVLFTYYLEWGLKNNTTYVFRLSILRLFRLFRVFRVYKYSSLIQLSIEVMIIAIKKSADALSALFFFMALSTIIFAALLYFAERGVWDEKKKLFVDANGFQSTFDSIPASFWFVMVTLTTTGYGDMVPTTFIGKLITFPAMIIGVLLIALPSIIVGRNFTIVWELMKHRGESGDAFRDISQQIDEAEAHRARRHVHSPDALHSPPVLQRKVDDTMEQLMERVGRVEDMVQMNQTLLRQLIILMDEKSE
jgi:hypothetical protein